MSGIRQGSHLEHLLELRDRVDKEIATERIRMKAADARRAQLAGETEQREQEAARAAVKEAERAERREAARAQREQQALVRLAEVDRIEATAPADLVRAWAREHDIAVGDRGRLPLNLRKQYLQATQPSTGATA